MGHVDYPELIWLDVQIFLLLASPTFETLPLDPPSS